MDAIFDISRLSSIWGAPGFKEGVKMLKKEDGRTESGECVVKFMSKKSAMYALIDMDRHYIGKKLIMACYGSFFISHVFYCWPFLLPCCQFYFCC